MKGFGAKEIDSSELHVSFVVLQALTSEKWIIISESSTEKPSRTHFTVLCYQKVLYISDLGLP